MNDQVKNEIEQTIKNNPITIYMKGSTEQPMCGFSAQAVSVLSTYKKPIKSINVLDNPDIRQGIKDFTNWPTIPQVFINGEFIGGCDIVTEMHANGELKKMIG